MFVHIQHASKSFNQVEVLKEINITFEKGKIYCLLGRNGAGKTTFFNCLSQNLNFDTGEVTLERQDQQRPLSENEVGYVLSVPIVPDFLTAREFLTFFRNLHPSAQKYTIEEYLEWVHFPVEDLDRLMKDYSHGMKNKIQLLVNLMLDSPILLLDEPLTSFDVVVAQEIKQILKSIKKDKIIIISTHLLDLAVELADEIVLLHKGVFTTMPNHFGEEIALKESVIEVLSHD